MTTLEDIYTREWFEHDFEHLQPEFDVVADSLVREFGLTPESLVHDIGCGPGMVLNRLVENGVKIRGLDGSSHGIAYAKFPAKDIIEHCNIVQKGSLMRADLVICTEVAEHLDAEHADHLVELLCSAMCPIVFTAADVGQDGHHHVNCQPKNYWVEKFESHGLMLDVDVTDNIATRWKGLKRLSHMRKNVMVFR